MDEIPIVRGQFGLTGRMPVRPTVERSEPDGFDEDGNPFWVDLPDGPSVVLPSNCLRVLNSPLREGEGGGCTSAFGGECVGRLRDGSCMAETVSRANEQGKAWSFDFDLRDERWVYTGELLR